MMSERAKLMTRRQNLDFIKTLQRAFNFSKRIPAIEREAGTRKELLPIMSNFHHKEHQSVQEPTRGVLSVQNLPQLSVEHGCSYSDTVPMPEMSPFQYTQ